MLSPERGQKIQESAAYERNKLCCPHSEDPNNPEDQKTKELDRHHNEIGGNEWVTGPSPPRLDVTTASTSDPLFVSWLTVKVRVRVAMLRTDQTVGSSVTNVRVVTVSGVTWTSFLCSHTFGYVSHGGVGSLSTGSPSGRGSGRSTSA